MTRFRCNTCSGTYSDTQPDGSLYFHRCPPVTVPGAQPDPALPGFTPPTQHERPNFRDENLKAGLTFEEGSYVTHVPLADDPNLTRAIVVADPIRAQGAGRTAVP